MSSKEENIRDTIEQLKKDFKDFKEECMGVLLFGSHAKGEQTRRSDVDVCVVKPSKGCLDDINAKLGGKYDLKVFEHLPLYVKIDIIKHHKTVYGEELELSEYSYFFRKLWKDMEHRIEENRFKNFDERMRLRRRWLDEKEKILGKVGSI
jgi:hypothetical protein